jgi:two-component system NtrC family response regulator
MFRINAFEIRSPALRERLDDVPELARHLLARFRKPLRSDDEAFTPEALKLLESHVWPGNVRELANVVEHASILCDELPIDVEHLPRNFENRRLRTPSLRAIGPLSLRELEMQAIHQALERHAGNKPRAAEELGISLKTLYNKLNTESSLEQSA